MPGCERDDEERRGGDGHHEDPTTVRKPEQERQCRHAELFGRDAEAHEDAARDDVPSRSDDHRDTEGQEPQEDGLREHLPCDIEAAGPPRPQRRHRRAQDHRGPQAPCEQQESEAYGDVADDDGPPSVAGEAADRGADRGAGQVRISRVVHMGQVGSDPAWIARAAASWMRGTSKVG